MVIDLLSKAVEKAKEWRGKHILQWKEFEAHNIDGWRDFPQENFRYEL